MNHPALVKTSDQTLISSVSFRRSLLQRLSSDISPVPSLNLQPIPRGGTVKKISSSRYRKFVGATQEKKIKQTTKSKTNRLGSNALLSPSKRRKRRVCRDPTPSDTPSDSDTGLVVLLMKIRRIRSWLSVLYWSFLWRPQRRWTDTMCEIFQIGVHTLCRYGGRFNLWTLSGINTVLFLVCTLCTCIFF